MTERIPAEVFPPGEFLQDELNARDWTQVEFAEIIRRPPRLINEIIAGKRAITPDTAKEIAAALGTSAQFWLNLEISYQLSKARPVAENIARTAKLHENFPIREMVKRGWIESSSNTEVIETQVLKFFDLKSIEDDLELPHAAKKPVHNYEDKTISKVQRAWIYRVKQIAKSVAVPKYSEKALREAIPQLRNLLLTPEEIRHIPRILMECGIRFIVVEALPSAKIDGVTLWLDKTSPVIGMSLFRDQIDNFWFVLRHEIEHILNHDGQEIGEIIDPDLSGDFAGVSDDLPEVERQANAAAADFCVPTQKIEAFIIRKKPFFYERDVVAFAELQKVHPGLVVGQMQYRLNKYDWLKKYLVKVRHFLINGSIVDGWGHVASV